MKKKLISAALTGAMVLSSLSLIAMADNNPKVIVNSRQIAFADQNPVIVDDRTLVPARGVFEAMGASVEWWNEERMVVVRSADNKTRVDITIDDPIMKVHTFTSLTTADTKEVTLDVAPQIMNDRTMIPLRAISEALGADVKWDENSYTVTILSIKLPTVTKATPKPNGESDVPSTSNPNATPTPTSDPSSTTSPVPSETDKPSSGEYVSDIPVLYLTTDKTEVAVGEEFSVYVNVTCCEKDFDSASTTVLYDKSKFEYVDSKYNYSKEQAQTLGGVNENFMGDSVKCVTVPMEVEPITIQKDGVMLELKFKALTADSASFSLSARKTDVGYDNELFFTDKTKAQKAEDLYIDTTPVTVTAK